MPPDPSTRPPADGAHDPRDPLEYSAPLVTRLGTLVGAAALAALAASIPAALRIVQADHVSGGRVWLALASVALAPMVVLVGLLRSARAGLRAFRGEGSGARTFGFVLWLAATSAALVVYGGVLRATTHHHALAGVTFALGALVIAGALAILVGRFVALALTRSPLARTTLFAALSVVLTFGLIGVGVPVARALVPATGALLLDVLALGISAAFASRASLSPRRVLARVGPPVALSVLAFGFAVLRSSPTLGDVIHARAPLFAAAVDLARH